MKPAVTLCWFRRDLRLDDHAAAYHALKNSHAVHAVFVFDTDILHGLPPDDRRVSFIWRSVHALQRALRQHGSDLHILHGSARSEIPRLAQQLGAEAVFYNHDDEPAALARDAAVAQQLAAQDIAFHSYKDHVIFERDEVLNGSGKPFAVFTPYKNAWLKKLNDFYLAPYPTEQYAAAWAKFTTPLPCPSLESLGFTPAAHVLPDGMAGADTLFTDFQTRITQYHAQRDFPALKGVSYLSPHLRFGTLSIRGVARYAHRLGGEGGLTWLNELIWRDFYQMLLSHHPHVVQRCFKPAFDALQYPNNPDFFQAWQDGRTGYPLVDAAMRQLRHSGWMHNRLRMVVASFLVKDLHIDWRWGERHFAEQLLDFDLAANNGGWQWAASTGCDAQPWFRIFNPITQSEKFDPHGKFIRRYVPELANCPDRHIHTPWLAPAAQRGNYPPPIVDHATARQGWLAMCKVLTP